MYMVQMHITFFSEMFWQYIINPLKSKIIEHLHPLSLNPHFQARTVFWFGKTAQQ